jgi:hypothetical protein
MKFSAGLLFVLAISLCMSSVLGFTARANSGSNTLNVRSAANAHSNVVAMIPSGSQFDIDCQIGGDTISGLSGTTNTWYHVPSRGGYVSGAYVATGGQGAPGCGAAKANTGSNTLNVRSSPNSHSGLTGSYGPGAELNIDCQVAGESVSGLSGTTNMWYHVPAKGGYVSGAFISTGGRSYPSCGNTPAPTPSGADCSAGLPNPRSCAQAVAYAEARLTNSFNAAYRGLCDHFVGMAYGRSASGFNTALIHWQTTPERFRHTDRNPPVGALVFFRSQSGMGHVTISTGGGNVISTDFPQRGNLGRTSISWIESHWGAPYLGWTAPYFHNA